MKFYRYWYGDGSLTVWTECGAGTLGLFLAPQGHGYPVNDCIDAMSDTDAAVFQALINRGMSEADHYEIQEIP